MFESLYDNVYCYEELKPKDKIIANAYMDAIEEVENTDYICDFPPTLEKLALEITADYKSQIITCLETRLKDFYISSIDSYDERIWLHYKRVHRG